MARYLIVFAPSTPPVVVTVDLSLEHEPIRSASTNSWLRGKETEDFSIPRQGSGARGFWNGAGGTVERFGSQTQGGRCMVMVWRKEFEKCAWEPSSDLRLAGIMGKIPQTHRKHTHPADTCTQTPTHTRLPESRHTHTLGTDKHRHISQQIMPLIGYVYPPQSIHTNSNLCKWKLSCLQCIHLELFWPYCWYAPGKKKKTAEHRNQPQHAKAQWGIPALSQGDTKLH